MVIASIIRFRNPCMRGMSDLLTAEGIIRPTAKGHNKRCDRRADDGNEDHHGRPKRQTGTKADASQWIDYDQRENF